MKTQKPYAHIRASSGDAYCGQSIPYNEFAFTEPHYAVKFYDARTTPRTPLVACEHCCDAVRARERRERAA